MNHRYPHDLFIIGHDTQNDGPTGCLDEREPDSTRIDDDVALITDRKAAIDFRTGKEYGFTEEGIIAVYRLVEIIEVTQHPSIKVHKVKPAKKGTRK